MKILVTGSAGHLGEAIVRTLKDANRAVAGVDIIASPHTGFVGSITQRDFVKTCMKDVDAVIHTATLHKPHVRTHSKQDFIDTNISGTLNLLEESLQAGIRSFAYTSTTSVFGNALVPPPGEPAAWITEDTAPQPKNIYGITKLASENLCELFARKHALPVTVLRISRFFPEEDDSTAIRAGYADENAKANEFLFRRVDIHDAVQAHLDAVERPPQKGFARYIISATTPFTKDDLAELRSDAASVLRRHMPAYEAEYARRGWNMFPLIDRVYVNEKARRELGWKPLHDFRWVLESLKADKPVLSATAQIIGQKGYHSEVFENGPYPVDEH